MVRVVKRKKAINRVKRLSYYRLPSTREGLHSRKSNLLYACRVKYHCHLF